MPNDWTLEVTQVVSESDKPECSVDDIATLTGRRPTATTNREGTDAVFIYTYRSKEAAEIDQAAIAKCFPSTSTSVYSGDDDSEEK